MAPKETNGDEIPFDVFVAEAPVTRSRFPATTIDKWIEQPNLPRANAAVSTDSPKGDEEYGQKYKDYSVLQQHVLFWDRDGDGQIYPWDTYVGFRELGFNMIFSLLAMVIINAGFSYPTRLAYSLIPDPWFRVYVGSIHKAKVSMLQSNGMNFHSRAAFDPCFQAMLTCHVS